MDNNPKPFSEEARKILYNKLADTMLMAVENSYISFEDGQESSKYILDRLDNVTTYLALLSFLEDLSKQWPIYRPVLHDIQELEQEHHDDKQQEKIEQELEQLSQN